MEERFRISYLLLFLFLSQAILLLLTDFLLIDDSLYYDLWGNVFSYEKIRRIIEEGKKWKWVNYFFLPLYAVVKCILISTCFLSGAFFLKIKYRFSSFFRISLFAEFFTLFPLITKIIWFGFFQRNYGLNDLTTFSPLSIINLFERGELDTWFIYPLQLLNIFELLYWLALVYLLKELINKNFAERLSFVASTYGVGLFIWVLFIMFLTVSFS